jgi:hypothetical protein
VKKVEGVGVQGAVRIELEVGPGISEDPRGVVLSLVNPAQKDEGICLVGVEPEGLKGAALRIRDSAERKLHEPETIVAHPGTRRDQETSPNQGFGLAVVSALIKDHRESEQGRCKATVGQVDRFLEVLRGGVKLAKTRECKAKIVVGTIGVRSLFDNGAEVREAGLEIALEEEGCPLFKGMRGFVGHREFLNGDDGIVARRWRIRGRLRETRGRRK